MENEIEFIKKKLMEIFPSALYTVCERFLDAYPNISEIRLRRGAKVTFTQREHNIESGYLCDPALLNSCISNWVERDRYKHADCLVSGVISLGDGFRAGIVGTALLNKGELIDIYNISSANIRIPRRFYGVSLPLYEHLTALPYPSRSTLLISPPCGGKTTVLRDLARILSTPPVSERVCVVDPRKELSFSDEETSRSLDIFDGYPTALGIELATRYFNPQYVICDEIATVDELEAVRNTAHSGVPIIASAHAHSLLDAIKRPILYLLLKEEIFQNVAELALTDRGISFKFIDRSEVAKIICP